jgi:hypothetical protein
MKTRLALLLSVTAAFLLSACAGMMGPREYTVPLHKLQESMSRKFPFNNRYLDLLDINISNPRLAMQPQSNRLVTSMDALVAPPFLQKSWKGTFTLSGGLRFDAGRNAIMLSDPRVEGFAIDGLDPLYSRQIAKVGSLIAEQLFRDTPLYTFRPDELRYGGTSFLPTKINARANGLVVTFEPVR